MSLQVWLPLKGNLENLGLAGDVEFKNVDDDNIWGIMTDGKIGSSWTFDESHLRYVGSPVSSDEMSVAFWVFVLSWSTNYDTFFQLGAGTAPWASYTFGILRNKGTNICAVVSDGTNSTASSCSTAFDIVGAWHHIAATFKPGTLSLYIDGVLKKEITTTIEPDFGSASYCTIGRTNGKSYPCDCALNDFRIYDHCLSAKEVKLISQALVCHYPLDDQFIEATTNLRTWQLPSSGTWDEIWGGSTTVWSIYDTTYEPVPFDRCYKGEITYSGSSGGASRQIQTLDILPSTTYTYSAYIKASDDFAYTHANFLYRYEYPGDASNTGTRLYEGGVFNKANMQSCGNGWYRCWGTFTTLADTNSIRIAFCTYPNKNITYYVGGWMLEQKDHVTPYVFGSRDSDGTVYDCSGYGNHGTMSDTPPSVSNDSPRYLSCMEFAGTNNYIEFQNLDVMPAILPKEWSIAFWVYNDDVGNRSVYFSNWNLGGIGGNSFGLEKSTSERLRIYCMNGSFDLNVPAANLTITGSEWIHLCVTKNSDNLMTIYKNGSSVYTYTNNYCTSLGKVYRIGADQRSTTDISLKGKMSDFRIYATALSTADVKELYETSASVDNHGNMYAYEFNELDRDMCDVPLSKNGNGAGTFTITNNEVVMNGYIWVWYPDYQEVDTDKYDYHYNIEYSSDAGNMFYIGWEKYDANKTATTNSSTVYVVSTSKTAKSHETVSGDLSMSNLTGNPTKYIRLRILNSWSGSTSSNLSATIHKLHLYAIPK